MTDIKQDFEKIYSQYYDFIYKFLIKNVGGKTELAEELTQETFFQIFLSLHRYRGECDIKTWMCKIALNVMYKYFKKNPQMAQIDIVFEAIDDKVSLSAEEEYLRQEKIERLRKVIFKLRKKYRDVIIYRTYLQLSFKEISQIMNITENNAKVLYIRGKEQIRKYL